MKITSFLKASLNQFKLLISILGEEDYAAGRRHWKNGSFSSCDGCKINRDFHDRFIREESFLKSDTQKINMYNFALFPQQFVNTKRVSIVHVSKNIYIQLHNSTTFYLYRNILGHPLFYGYHWVKAICLVNVRKYVRG